MATLEAVNEILRNLRPDAVAFRDNEEFVVTLRQGEYTLTNAELDDYLSVRTEISLEPETAVFMPGYYEHLVDIPNSSPTSYRMLRLDERPIELTSADGQMSIRLAPPSLHFLLAVLDKAEPGNLTELRRRALIGRYVSSRLIEEKRPNLRDLFMRFVTLQVAAAEGSRLRARRSTLQAIADAALFNISFARGIGLSLSRSWERNYYRLGSRRVSDIQFPRRTYTPDLLAYYHLALASDSSILAYLSLYKILEFFYVSTAEAVLHRRLKNKLSSPDFSPKQATSLREIVSLVRKFDQRTDEQRMLAGVLEHYFMADEIATWITEHETLKGEYYTVPQALLGITHCVDLTSDQVFSSLARRIYHIRNALVHNKEGDLPRFIPFSEHDEILMKELPLIMFLTEQLIIKTGQDI